MREIERSELQLIVDSVACCNPITGKPASKKLLKELVSGLKRLFRYIEEEGAILKSPASRLTVPSGAPEAKRSSLGDDAVALIEEVSHRMQIAAMLMLYCGLRRGEMVALRWEDINFAMEMISIGKAAAMPSNQPSVKLPKSKAGIRSVYMPDRLVDFLLPKAKPYGLVLEKASGGMMTASAWKRGWDSYLLALSKAAGYPVSFTAHWLRHTYISMLASKGVHPTVAAALAGHASASVTLGVYTHALETDKQMAAKKL
ncbi:MAG: site-specific integrase [Eubacteriaceae bacterium]|nr:site-specific integrase [Eubacteriaceae bacterium]